MSFLSPIWLIGLLPWAGVTLWLLWGRRKRTNVPFLDLWRSAAEDIRAKRSMQTPPAALAMAIAAMLLAVLAMAGPVLSGVGAGRGPAINLVLDRGITMSARAGANGPLRFREAAADAARELERRLGPAAPIDLVDVPLANPAARGTISTDPAHLAAVAASLPPTAVDTSAALTQAVGERLRSSDGPIIVISDQPLQVSDPRLIQMSPDGQVQNVGITRLAVRQHLRPQVMVRVRNQSALSAATLRVHSGKWHADQPIELPARDGARDYFIDAPRLGDAVDAELLNLHDGLDADNHAWLVREESYPRIAVRTPVPEALRRMVDIYRALRLPTDASRELLVVGSAKELDGPMAGAAVAAPASAPEAAGPALAIDHPVTRSVNWATMPARLAAAPDPPPGWQPLVTAGGRTLVAARAEPARQVWIGFDTAAWSGSADYVIFWTNVFDWIGEGGDRFTSYPMEALDLSWAPLTPPADSASSGAGAERAIGPLPGIFVRPDGLRRAFNVAPVAFGPPGDAGWRERLAAEAGRPSRGLSLGPWILVGALLCVAGAALTWRKRRSALELWSHDVPPDEVPLTVRQMSP